MKTISFTILSLFAFNVIVSQSVSLSAGYNLFESPCIFQDCYLIQSETYATKLHFPLKNNKWYVGAKYRMYSRRGILPYKSDKGLLIHHYLDKNQNVFDYEEYNVGVKNLNNKAVFWGHNSKFFGAYLGYHLDFQKYFLNIESGINLELDNRTFPYVLTNDGLGKLVDPNNKEITIVGAVSYHSYSQTWIVGNIGLIGGHYITKHFFVSLGLDFNLIFFDGAYFFIDLGLGYKF